MPVELPIIDITGWIVVGALVLISMVRGWLVASTQIDKLIAAYDKIILDKDKQIDNWKTAFENSDARADVLSENQRVLLESIQTTNALIKDLTLYRPMNERETSK